MHQQAWEQIESTNQRLQPLADPAARAKEKPLVHIYTTNANALPTQRLIAVAEL